MEDNIFTRLEEGLLPKKTTTLIQDKNCKIRTTQLTSLTITKTEDTKCLSIQPITQPVYTTSALPVRDPRSPSRYISPRRDDYGLEGRVVFTE